MKKLYVPLVLLFLFIGMILLLKSDSFIRLDLVIGESIYSLHAQPLFSLFYGIGMLGSTTGIIVLLILSMIMFIFIQKTYVTSILLFLSVLVGNVSNKLMKALISRERPPYPNHTEDGFSFPSGHMMVGSILFGMITYYVVKNNANQKVKLLTVITTSVLLLVIGFSRLLEGEHFLTDILGGLFAGGLLLIAFFRIDELIDANFEGISKKKDVQV